MQYQREWLRSCMDLSWLQQRLLGRPQDPITGIKSMQTFFDQAKDNPRCSAVIVLTAKNAKIMRAL